MFNFLESKSHKNLSILLPVFFLIFEQFVYFILFQSSEERSPSPENQKYEGRNIYYNEV